MVTTFNIDQFVSITDVQRKMGEVTVRLKKEDIVVLRNNKPDFVMVNIDVYKMMKEALDFAEQQDVFQTVQKRKNKKAEIIDSSQMAEKLLRRVISSRQKA
ncbi:type II toxin-antitoxin system Phd/YefM family antitoxin [Peptococcaceae bacterium]|nr:type II toxin-antitoxin system Phd/YefM family antitoxin [Peptococcaceae bacterium]